MAERDRAPQRFGRYELIARVASGGMGTVFLARAHGEGGFNRLFTLKVLHAHLSNNSEFITLMQREARIAARLHHPNIVPIVDVGSADDAFYIVMDYVEGCSFADLLNHHPEYRPPAVTVSTLLDALSGLHAAHELVDEDGRPLNLVHRDLSPENMLLGVDGHCRLIDFGIAKAADPVQLTKPGVVRGKPAYMSPEHVTGSSLDRRSDLFAMGVVLFNALTGKRLFDGASPHATMYNVLKRRLPKPSQVGLCPPACFDAVVLKALERDPARRFQTAQEMSEALRAAALAGGHLGSGADVAKLVISSFGAQLEERRQKTREFLRARDATVPTTLHTLPELTLSAIGLQPTLTPSRTEKLQLLSWDELSREPESVLPEPVPSSLSGAELSASMRAPGWRRRWALTAGLAAIVAVALVGAGYLLANKADDANVAPVAVDKPSAPVRSSTAEQDVSEPNEASKTNAANVAPSSAPTDAESQHSAPKADHRPGPSVVRPATKDAKPRLSPPPPARHLPRSNKPHSPPQDPPSTSPPAAPPAAQPTTQPPRDLAAKVESNPYLRAE